MGPTRLKPVISSFLLLLILLLSGERLEAQEWFDELMLKDNLKKKTNIHDVRDKADKYFKYAKKEYFSRYFELGDYPELLHKNIREYISYKRWEEYWLNHVDNKGYPVSPLDEYKEYTDFISSSSKGPIASWVNINRTEAYGGYWGMGRIREIAFHPTDPNTMWLGADQGGIWKTEDNGNTYTPVGDGLPFLRVSSICVDPTNPDILYMAGGGIGTNYWQRAIGVYKTIDGGENWTATGFVRELEDALFVRRLAMSPTDPSVLIVTTKQGTYRTADGGDTWNRVNSNEAWDIIFHPDGSTVFIGKGSSIIKSEDGGITWASKFDANESGIFKHMAISPVDSDYLAAQCETGDYVSTYVSSDKGLSWTLKSKVEDSGGTIGFSSRDVNTLYRGWTKIYKSTNMGASWEQITNWYNNGVHEEVHADHFRIEKHPLRDNKLYFCNDGGMYILNEESMTWTEKSDGLIISQYYSLSSSQSDPTVLLCGSQDNGGWYRQSDGSWRTTNGGDGMHTWQSPVNIQYGYSSYPGGKIYRSVNGWRNYAGLFENIEPEPLDGDWNSRFAIDPNNHKRIVSGCFRDVYESTDMGESWEKISSSLTGGYNLHAITIPETNSNIIYTSSGPYLYFTYNGGETWSNSYVGAGYTIQEIAVSDYDPMLVWVVTSGFADGSKVFRSENGGKTWTNISGSLPNISALSIVHRKGTVEDLYVGMSYGIYYRNKDMNDWEFYGHGIPNTEIRDLDIQYSEDKIRAATYGRGLYEADLHDLSGTIPVADYSIDNTTACAEESVTFTNLSTDATSVIWNFGDGISSTLDNPEHIFMEPGEYTVRLTAFNGNNASTYMGESKVTVKPGFEPLSLGAKNPGIGHGKSSGGDDAGLIFNVHTPSKLLSVSVYSKKRGNYIFEIRDSNGELINSVNSRVREGENIIELNTELPVGKDFILSAANSDGLFYNTAGATYPYGVDMLVSITGNTRFMKDHYYFFYNWEVQYAGCEASALPRIREGDNIPVEQVIAYPNPAKDRINLRIYGFDPGESITLRLITMDGRTVFSKDMDLQRNFELDLNSALGNNTGSYIIEISSENNSIYKQILRIPE